jgi:AcrR family transcriptional regulator
MASFYERFLKKKPQQSRSRMVVDAILTTALDRVSRLGESDSLSVQEVAARAGVGTASLYDYFKDRGDLLSAAAMKAAQDNLDAFHALLEASASLPLQLAVENIVDHALETYASDPPRSQSVLRLTMRLGLMPMLAQSQARFAASLADALRRRTDVYVTDVDAAAWLVTQSMMGIVHTLVWDANPPDRASVREAAVELFTTALAGQR